jgi:hypothetical protein
VSFVEGSFAFLINYYLVLVCVCAAAAAAIDCMETVRGKHPEYKSDTKVRARERGMCVI